MQTSTVKADIALDFNMSPHYDMIQTLLLEAYMDLCFTSICVTSGALFANIAQLESFSGQ